MKIKSYPVGQGNHNNIHYLLKIKDLLVLKLCYFPDTQKIYIMSCSFKVNIDYLNLSTIHNDIVNELLEHDLHLVSDSDLFKFFNLRFDNTKHLMSSDYYIKSRLKLFINSFQCNNNN